MSQLVSDIFITSVWRNARRFSLGGFLDPPPSDPTTTTPTNAGPDHDILNHHHLPPPPTDDLVPECLTGALHPSLDACEMAYPASVDTAARLARLDDVPPLDTPRRTHIDHEPRTSELTRQLALTALERPPPTDDDTFTPRLSESPHPLQVTSERPTAEVTEISTASAPIHPISHTPESYDGETPTAAAAAAMAIGRSGSAAAPVLAEDDGMRELRTKILAIQSQDVPASEKARLMHDLFTERYNQQQRDIMTAKLAARPHSPDSIISQELPVSPTSPFGFWRGGSSPTISSSYHGHTIYLSPEDLEPTFAPIEEVADEDEDDYEVPGPTYGCQHYKRNVKLQCSACAKWYTCRFCHDEVEDHMLNRRETKNMLCMACGYAQPASADCIECGLSAASYFCRICKLWDNDPTKSIYHCDDCGICRVGQGLGKDFIHCKTCGVCMSISRWDFHRCLERSVDCNCPICEEYLRDSTRSVVFMRCGHCIHKDCYDDHLKSSYKCPICNKSTINMETQFLNLDRAIESQPMPPQFQDTLALVKCNDCFVKCVVKYHWLGLKCTTCHSYNTREIQILNETDARELARYNAERQNTQAIDRSHMVERSQTMNIPPRVDPVETADANPHSRLRRHSSHNAHSEIPPPTSSSAFSSYALLRRMGRSVSPGRFASFMTRLTTLDDCEEKPDEPEEDLDVWDGRGRQRSTASSDAEGSDFDEDDASSTSESDQDDDDDDDEDDENDIIGRLELIGHR